MSKPNIKKELDKISREIFLLFSGLGIVYSFMILSLFNIFEIGLTILEMKKQTILLPQLSFHFWWIFASFLFLITSYILVFIYRNENEKFWGRKHISFVCQILIMASLIVFIVWLFFFCYHIASIWDSWYSVLSV